MAFKLLAYLGMDGSGFERGLKKSEDQAKGFADKMTRLISGGPGGILAAGAGALGIGALFSEASHAIDELKEKAKDIRIGSARMDIDTDQYQRLKNVLEAKNLGVDSAAAAFDKLAIAQTKIKDGDADAAKLVTAFGRLGVSSKDILKLDYKALFFGIGENIRSTEMSAEKLAAIRDLLGRGGTALIPAFKEGFDSKISQRGLLDEEHLDDISRVSKMTKENTSVLVDMSEAFKINILKAFGGLLSLPSSFKDIFSGPRKTDGAQNARAAAQRKRLDELTAEAALKEAEERKATAAIDKRAKHEDAAYAAQQKQNEEKDRALTTQIEKEKRALALSFAPTPTKRLEILQKENAELERRNRLLEAYMPGGGAPSAFTNQHKENELKELANKREMLGILTKSHRLRDADSLSKIGGFGMNVDRGLETITKQQVKILGEIKAEIKRLELSFA